jgi:probable phosphoglycerate mutase
MAAPASDPAPSTAASTTPSRRRGTREGPPSTLVLLVRHGTTPSTGQVLPGRAPGLHLADSGRDQAARVAGRLADWAAASTAAAAGRNGSAKPRVAAVYTSPLERTRETAAPIAAALGLRPLVHRGLLECDFGEWTGGSLKQLAKLPEWQTVQRYPSGFQFPGGESFVGMSSRIVDTLRDLRARHPRQTIVAVSHADPIKAAVADALGTHLDLFQRIVVSPCSVTAISYGPLGPVVLAVNSTGTLTELVPS